MKVTIERHIAQAGNAYKVYTHNPDKSLSELFVFDEKRDQFFWSEEQAKQKAIAHAEKLLTPIVESVEEVFNSDKITEKLPEGNSGVDCETN